MQSRLSLTTCFTQFDDCLILMNECMCFLNFHYIVILYINIDCVSEILCKLYEGGPSYGNCQPAV